jgi:hypothetical protein
MLAGVDTLVFDIQDIGCRFYTYVATMRNAMEAAAKKGLRFVVLDRPNPIGGVAMEGPVLGDEKRDFVGAHRVPLRHGMTAGELARMITGEDGLGGDLQIVRCEGWHRADTYERTGLPWIDPSPNMRRLSQALTYPGIGLLEGTEEPLRVAVVYAAARVPYGEREFHAGGMVLCTKLDRDASRGGVLECVLEEFQQHFADATTIPHELRRNVCDGADMPAHRPSGNTEAQPLRCRLQDGFHLESRRLERQGAGVGTRKVEHAVHQFQQVFAGALYPLQLAFACRILLVLGEQAAARGVEALGRTLEPQQWFARQCRYRRPLLEQYG